MKKELLMSACILSILGLNGCSYDGCKRGWNSHGPGICIEPYSLHEGEHCWDDEDCSGDMECVSVTSANIKQCAQKMYFAKIADFKFDYYCESRLHFTKDNNDFTACEIFEDAEATITCSADGSYKYTICPDHAACGASTSEGIVDTCLCDDGFDRRRTSSGNIFCVNAAEDFCANVDSNSDDNSDGNTEACITSDNGFEDVQTRLVSCVGNRVKESTLCECGVIGGRAQCVKTGLMCENNNLVYITIDENHTIESEVIEECGSKSCKACPSDMDCKFACFAN